MALVPSAKRARVGDALSVVPPSGSGNAIVKARLGSRPERLSSLDAPSMRCEGHDGAVMTMKFSPDGALFASGGADRHIFLWRVRGECENVGVLRGHRNAVLELHWLPDGARVCSASPDGSVRVFDVEAGAQVKRWEEHVGMVNACCPARRGAQLVVSGGDDGCALLWDLRRKRVIGRFQEKFQVTAVALSEHADVVFSAGIGNAIHAWDLRKGLVGRASRGGAASEGGAGASGAKDGGALRYRLRGHRDTVTGMALSHDGSRLLTSAMDGDARVWDVQPFCQGGASQRCLTVIGPSHGATGGADDGGGSASRHHANPFFAHGFEKNLLKCAWSPDDGKITGGSADGLVRVWDMNEGALAYQLPGHAGSVNEAVFHPSEPILGSCSTDKTIYLGEIDMN